MAPFSARGGLPVPANDNVPQKPTVVSLFAGAGGFDLGFRAAGFRVVWANDNALDGHATFRVNHPGTPLDGRDIRHVPSRDVPDADGVIGGPPCQAFSPAGRRGGTDDPRGRLFDEFNRIVEDKRPQFFIAENVQGLLNPKFSAFVTCLLARWRSADYEVSWRCLDLSQHGVPQSRKRVFFVGYRRDLDLRFDFSRLSRERRTLRDAIWDLRHVSPPSNDDSRAVNDNDYLSAKFSTRYLAANRIRGWDEPSYTIVATAASVPCHPDAPKMMRLGPGRHQMAEGHAYRRLTLRECARVQTFPDWFRFLCDNLLTAYRLIGNAVPPLIARRIAELVLSDLRGRQPPH